MSILHFENLNLFEDNLEHLETQDDSWSKVKFVGVKGPNNYLVRINTGMLDEHTIEASEDKLRFVIVLDSDDHRNRDAEITNEFRIADDRYIPCEILNQKGKFYSISTNTQKESEKFKVTKIIRENEIRKIIQLKFSEFLANNYGSIHIKIPNEIKNWTESDSFNELIKNLSEDFSLCFYSTYVIDERNPESTESNTYIRIFSYKNHLNTIQLIIEVAIENELKLLKYESDKISTLQKLETVKKELDKIKKFYISKELVGLLIGSKGANVNRLKQKYEVNIVIQSDLPGDEALVTITGENEKHVEDCMKESKFVKKSIEIRPNADSRLKSMITDLIQKYNLIKLFITRDKYKDEKRGTYYLPYLNIIGTEDSLEEVFKSKEITQHLINY
jgi:hypothetical protein